MLQKTLVPIRQETRWAPQPVWSCRRKEQSLVLDGIQTLDHPNRNLDTLPPTIIQLHPAKFCDSTLKSQVSDSLQSIHCTHYYSGSLPGMSQYFISINAFRCCHALQKAYTMSIMQDSFKIRQIDVQGNGPQHCTLKPKQCLHGIRSICNQDVNPRNGVFVCRSYFRKGQISNTAQLTYLMLLLVTHNIVMLAMCIEFDFLRHCQQTSFGSAPSPVQWVLTGFFLGGMTDQSL